MKCAAEKSATDAEPTGAGRGSEAQSVLPTPAASRSAASLTARDWR
jgi:hypothetical protein